jgi:hypothetical protein
MLIWFEWWFFKTDNILEKQTHASGTCGFGIDGKNIKQQYQQKYLVQGIFHISKEDC